MSPAALTGSLYAMLVLLRSWRLASLWRLPTVRRADWVFDARLGADHPERQRIVRGYRLGLAVPAALVELAALADLAVFWRLGHVLYVQVPLTWGLALIRRVVVRRAVLETRDLARPEAGARRLALSLRPRRLGAYTSPTFEVVNTALALAALGGIAAARADHLLLPAALLVYYEIGAVLWKLSMLRRPVPLPAERASDYEALVEDTFRAAVRTLDLVRGVCTATLLLVLARATMASDATANTRALTTWLFAALAVGTVGLLVHNGRRGRRLLARARTLGVPSRLPLADPENLTLGGLLYHNADNPAVVVDGGPLRLAVNVRNAATYAYVAYWSGLLVLLFLVGRGA